MTVAIEDAPGGQLKATLRALGKVIHITATRDQLEAYSRAPLLGMKGVRRELGLDENGIMILGRQLGIALSTTTIEVIVNRDQAGELASYGYVSVLLVGDEKDRLSFRLEPTELLSLGLCLDEMGYEVAHSPATVGPPHAARLDLSLMKKGR